MSWVCRKSDEHPEILAAEVAFIWDFEVNAFFFLVLSFGGRFNGINNMGSLLFVTYVFQKSPTFFELQPCVFPVWQSFSNAKLYLACTAAYLALVPSAICPDRCTTSQTPLLLCILLSSCPKLGGSKVEVSVKLSQTNEDAHWSVVCVCVCCCQMGLHCYTALGVKTAELSLKLQSRQWLYKSSLET